MTTSFRRLVITHLFVLATAVALCGVAAPCAGADNDALQDANVLYLAGIKPLLSEKCFACHGALRAESGLRLDALQLIEQGGDSGQVVKRGEAESSVLLHRISSKDLEQRMPPEGEGTALTTEQIALLRDWINRGLPGPDAEPYLSGPQEHWAYRPIERPAFKESPGDAVAEHRQGPIDLLLANIHRERGIQATSAASDLVWLRRVYFDLHGLPPTAEDILAFDQNPSSNRKSVLVDQLLGSPRYGERWGRHWMDVWRYSDWDGYKDELRGSQRHIWHWRDWIIESLNENKPYDQMIVEMLAGDELAPGDSQTLRATGFLARNFHKSNRDIWLDATVEHTGKAFLGLTFNCARCHDHKYDPISQQAYYQFRALFEPHEVRTDPLPGNSDTKLSGIPRVFDAKPDAPTYLYIRGNEKQPLKDSPISPGVVDWLPARFNIEPIALPLESYFPALSAIERDNRMRDLQRAVDKAREEFEESMTAAHPASQTPEKLSLLEARFSALESLQTAGLSYEIALAEQHAWQARYAADTAKYSDQASAQHDAQPLARQAALAELHQRSLSTRLDVLQKRTALNAAKAADEKDETKRNAAIAAAEKALKAANKKEEDVPITLAFGDNAYTPVGDLLPTTSTGRRLALARWVVAPENPLPARVAVNHIWMRHFGSPLVESVFDFGMKSPLPECLDLLDWLAAELVDSGWDMKHVHRLIVLSDAYARSSHVAEADASRVAYDPDNRLFWRANVQRLDAEQIRDTLLAVSGDLDSSFYGPDIDFEQGETNPRRSIYFRHAYEKQMSMLVLFDAASPNDCYRRKPSVIPQQALVLLNSPLVRTAARRLATRLSMVNDKPLNSSVDFTRQVFLATLSRLPSDEELRQCEQFLEKETLALQDSTSLALVATGVKPATPASPNPAMRARESLALVLLNHNDSLSVR